MIRHQEARTFIRTAVVNASAPLSMKEIVLLAARAGIMEDAARFATWVLIDDRQILLGDDLRLRPVTGGAWVPKSSSVSQCPS